MNKIKKIVPLLTFILILSILPACNMEGKRGETSDTDREAVEFEDNQDMVREEGTRDKEAEEEPATVDKKTAEQTEGSNPEDGQEDTIFLSAEDIRAMDAGTVLYQEDLANLEADISDLFTAEEIPDTVFSRMDGVSYGEGCIIPREELRYVRVLHMGFDGETHIGEIVCNKVIAEDLLEIFKELYDQKYPIEKILLVDDYGGNDELSMEDNNSSSFNFRPVAGTDRLSRHAYGLAIDINPLYNPYITSRGYTPENAGDYVDRSADNPYKIDENDLCFKLFDDRGFTWGGNWNSVKDYQHFQKDID